MIMASPPIGSLLIVALTAGIFILDLRMQANVFCSVLYLIPLFLDFWFVRGRHLLILTTICTTLTFLSFAFAHSNRTLNEEGFNLLGGVFMLWVTTFLLRHCKQVEEALQGARDEQEERVQERTESLVQANEALHVQVAERLKVEGVLRESEERFRLIMEHANDAIFFLGLNGVVQWASRGATVLTGRTLNELLDRPFMAVLAPETAARAEARLASVRQGESVPPLVELEILRPDGSSVWVEANSTSVQRTEGVVGRLLVLRDITERKKTAVREASRLRKLRQLSALGMQLSGDPPTIFEQVVRMIGELFEVRVVCLSEIVGGELLFKAVYRNGQVFQDAGRCPLDITPCATVEETKDLRVFDRVMERFPKASFLRDHNAFAYCGFPSIDGEGRVIAVTCLLDDKPHEFSDEDQEILRVIGQRITAEVERGRSITERKQAESLLARSRDFHLSILQEFPAMIWRSGVDAKCDYFNKAWLSFTGRTLEQEIGSGWAEGVHPNDVDQCVAGHLKAFHAHEPFVLEYRLRRYDGEYQYILDSGSPFNDLDGNFAGFIGFCYDITERKQAEEERARLLKDVQDSNARLQHLSRRMLEVQEEERRRIARELHDQTGQSLTSLLVGLRVLEDLPTLGRAQTQASDLRKITMDALKEVKRLAMGLRPALLDDLGLEAALKRLVKESAQTYRVSMDLHIKGLTNRRLPPPVETGFYRIAQEALTNMGRHAAAKNVSVLLTCSESSVKLIIEDDGCGFDVEKALRLPGSSKHLGLLGMHERVSLLNGTISVESTPDSGTTIYVQMPLEARPS